jgi:ABC-type multidrug transport system fused ATPase/permease subunit
MLKIFKILNFSEKIKIFLIVFSILITTSLEISLLLFIQPLLQLFLNIDTPNVNLNFFSRQFNFSNTFLFASFILIFFLRNIFYAITSFFKNKFVENLHISICNRIYTSYLNKDYIFFLRNNSARLTSNILNEINQFSYNVIDSFLIFLTEIFLITAIVIFLFFKFFIFSSILLLFCFLLFIFLILVYRKKMAKIGLQRATSEQKKIEDLQKSFYSIQSIKLDGIENFFINKFKNNISNSAKLISLLNFFNDLNKPIWEIFILVGFSFTMFIGYNFFGLFRTDLVLIIATFIIAFFRFLPSLNRTLNCLNSFRFYYPSINYIYHEVHSSDDFAPSSQNETVKKLKFFKEIQLKNISFQYDDNSQFILNNLNLKIAPNSITFIKGESGAGKSTLLNIMCGLLKPTTGEVLVDDKNINLFLKSYQGIVGYVPQKTLLSDDSILENIIFGKNLEDLDKNLINDVIHKSKLTKLIERLPNGLNTIIGERGSSLSGGEQQRIGIARALYKKPEILILDEATSALDEETEYSLLREILDLQKFMTIIMVSHKKLEIEKEFELFELRDNKINHIKC